MQLYLACLANVCVIRPTHELETYTLLFLFPQTDLFLRPFGDININTYFHDFYKCLGKCFFQNIHWNCTKIGVVVL